MLDEFVSDSLNLNGTFNDQEKEKRYINIFLMLDSGLPSFPVVLLCS